MTDEIGTRRGKLALPALWKAENNLDYIHVAAPTIQAATQKAHDYFAKAGYPKKDASIILIKQVAEFVVT